MGIRDLTQESESQDAGEPGRNRHEEQLAALAPWIQSQVEQIHTLKQIYRKARRSQAHQDLDGLYLLLRKYVNTVAGFVASVQQTLFETARQAPDDPKARRLLRVASQLHSAVAWPKIPLEYRDTPIEIYARTKPELGRWRLGDKEPWTVEWIERNFADGGVLYDVGANVGAYSLVAGAVAGEKGRVIAFEPAYRTYAALVDNIVLNGMERRITALPIGLSDKVSLSELRYRSNEAGAGMHGIGGEPVSGMKDFDATLVYPILTYSLDRAVADFGLPAPNFIKIDVDGHECELVEGARQTLASPSVRSVLIECTGDERRERIRRVLGEEIGLTETDDWSSTPEIGAGRVSYLLFERR